MISNIFPTSYFYVKIFNSFHRINFSLRMMNCNKLYFFKRLHLFNFGIVLFAISLALSSGIHNFFESSTLFSITLSIVKSRFVNFPSRKQKFSYFSSFFFFFYNSPPQLFCFFFFFFFLKKKKKKRGEIFWGVSKTTEYCKF